MEQDGLRAAERRLAVVQNRLQRDRVDQIGAARQLGQLAHDAVDEDGLAAVERGGDDEES